MKIQTCWTLGSQQAQTPAAQLLHCCPPATTSLSALPAPLFFQKENGFICSCFVFFLIFLSNCFWRGSLPLIRKNRFPLRKRESHIDKWSGSSMPQLDQTQPHFSGSTCFASSFVTAMDTSIPLYTYRDWGSKQGSHNAGTHCIVSYDAQHFAEDRRTSGISQDMYEQQGCSTGWPQEHSVHHQTRVHSVSSTPVSFTKPRAEQTPYPRYSWKDVL